jgi:hypothetical protein
MARSARQLLAGRGFRIVQLAQNNHEFIAACSRGHFGFPQRTRHDEQADVAPPLPENPVSRPGDLWLCGNRRNQHRMLCGDATSPEAALIFDTLRFKVVITY